MLIAFIFLVLVGMVANGYAEGIPVLIYHEILPNAEESGETKISLSQFEAQMKYLYEQHYTTISVDELIHYMKGGSAPEKSILLTFDDGWKSGLNAIPILEKYHFKAAFFIFPEKGIGPPYLEWNDVLSLAGSRNIEICSHTMTHPWDKKSNLVTWIDGKTDGKDRRDAVYEIKESKKLLEKKLNKKVNCFAWPVGWYNSALIKIAEEAGYEAVFTAEDGINTPGGDLFGIKRIFVDGACPITTFEQMLQDHTYHVCQTKGRPTQGHSPYH